MRVPSGLVTFLMTDVEKSTAMWRADAHEAASATRRQAEAISEAVAANDGYRPVEQGEGDSTVSVFAKPIQALTAAVDAQRVLGSSDLPAVRMGVHTGDAELVDGVTYGGTAIIKAARVRDLEQGGEILVSSTTGAVAGESLPDGALLVDIGEAVLKGFDQPEHVLRLEHPDVVGPQTELRGADFDLPTFPTELIGRAAEISEVAELLDRSHLVTITGSGGSGKTRLAHAVALQSIDRFPDGAAWVDLSRASDETQVGSAVAAACGLTEGLGVDLDKLLTRHLVDHELLVVVDNCEHLLGGVAVLFVDLLSHGISSRLLATTREPIGIDGETTWRIPSLSLPDAGTASIDEIASHDAIEMFVARATAADPGFRLDEQSAEHILQVCQRLDGIPLALELAAARVRAMSIADLAERLDDRFSLLTTSSRGGLERQRTLLASVQWSHELLDEQEQILFRRLSVFASPFTLVAAESVTGADGLNAVDVLGLLTQLVDKSLVRYVDGRYSMLETLRAFASDRAADADELRLLRERHLDWCLQRAASWGFPFSPEVVLDIDDKTSEAPDFVVAADWALRHRPDALPVLGTVLAVVWLELGQTSEAGALVEKYAEPLSEGSETWLAAVAPLSVESVMSGNYAWFEPTERALRAHPSLPAEFEAQLRTALVLPTAMSGDRAAIDHLQLLAEQSRAVGDRFSAQRAMAIAAVSLATFGELGRVRTILESVDREGAATRQWFALAIARATVLMADGRFADATAVIEPFLGRGNSLPCASASFIAWKSGDRELASRAEQAADTTDLAGFVAWVPAWARGCRFLLEDDLQAARDAFGEAQVKRNVFSAPDFSVTPGILAELDLVVDGPVAAEEGLDAVEAEKPSTMIDGRAFHRHIARSLAALELGDLARAMKIAREAVRGAAESGDRVGATHALYALALTLEANDDQDPLIAETLSAADGFAELCGGLWEGPYLHTALREIRGRIDVSTNADDARLRLDEMIERVTNQRE
jgi:predicted ATPase